MSSKNADNDSEHTCPECGYSTDTNTGISKHMQPMHNWQVLFWYYVDKGEEDECWEWQGRTTSSGYGRPQINGKRYSAHRLSYRIHYGPMPTPQVNHHCDNKLCVNPNHLYSGTQSENMQDAFDRISAFREHALEVEPKNTDPEREGMSGSPFEKSDIVSIRERYANGETGVKLAEEYGVATPTIYNIVNKKRYKNI